MVGMKFLQILLLSASLRAFFDSKILVLQPPVDKEDLNRRLILHESEPGVFDSESRGLKNTDIKDVQSLLPYLWKSTNPPLSTKYAFTIVKPSENAERIKVQPKDNKFNPGPFFIDLERKDGLRILRVSRNYDSLTSRWDIEHDCYLKRVLTIDTPETVVNYIATVLDTFADKPLPPAPAAVDFATAVTTIQTLFKRYKRVGRPIRDWDGLAKPQRFFIQEYAAKQKGPAILRLLMTNENSAIRIQVNFADSEYQVAPPLADFNSHLKAIREELGELLKQKTYRQVDPFDAAIQTFNKQLALLCGEGKAVLVPGKKSGQAQTPNYYSYFSVATVLDHPIGQSVPKNEEENEKASGEENNSGDLKSMPANLDSKPDLEKPPETKAQACELLRSTIYALKYDFGPTQYLHVKFLNKSLQAEFLLSPHSASLKASIAELLTELNDESREAEADLNAQGFDFQIGLKEIAEELAKYTALNLKPSPSVPTPGFIEFISEDKLKEVRAWAGGETPEYPNGTWFKVSLLRRNAANSLFSAFKELTLPISNDYDQLARLRAQLARLAAPPKEIVDQNDDLNDETDEEETEEYDENSAVLQTLGSGFDNIGGLSARANDFGLAHKKTAHKIPRDPVKEEPLNTLTPKEMKRLKALGFTPGELGAIAADLSLSQSAVNKKTRHKRPKGPETKAFGMKPDDLAVLSNDFEASTALTNKKTHQKRPASATTKAFGAKSDKLAILADDSETLQSLTHKKITRKRPVSAKTKAFGTKPDDLSVLANHSDTLESLTQKKNTQKLLNKELLNKELLKTLGLKPDELATLLTDIGTSESFSQKKQAQKLPQLLTDETNANKLDKKDVQTLKALGFEPDELSALSEFLKTEDTLVHKKTNHKLPNLKLQDDEEQMKKVLNLNVVDNVTQEARLDKETSSILKKVEHKELMGEENITNNDIGIIG